MKQLKRMLSLGLALVLAFCSLSAGMVVHADDQPHAVDAFASLKVNGTAIDLTKCPDEYLLLDYQQKTATIEWQLKDGWSISTATMGEDGAAIQSGAAAQIAADDPSAYLSVNGPDEAQFFYEIAFSSGSLKMTTANLYAGKGSVDLFQDHETLPGIDVVSLSSSNPSVIQVTAGESIEDCTLNPLSAGTSTITAVLLVNGEEKSISSDFTVNPAPKALKSLKVGGKKVNLSSHPVSYTNAKLKKNPKIVFKLNKGWKLTNASIKSSKTVKLKKKQTKTVKIVAKKGGTTFTYTLTLKLKK